MACWSQTRPFAVFSVLTTRRLFGESTIDDFYFNGAEEEMSSSALSFSNPEDIKWPSDFDLTSNLESSSAPATHSPTSPMPSSPQQTPPTQPTQAMQQQMLYQQQIYQQQLQQQQLQQQYLLQQHLQQQQLLQRQQLQQLQQQQQQKPQQIPTPSLAITPHSVPGTPFEPLSPMPTSPSNLSFATPSLSGVGQSSSTHEHNYYAPLAGGVGYIEEFDIRFIPSVLPQHLQQSEQQKQSQQQAPHVMSLISSEETVSTQPLEIIQMALMANQMSRQKISVLLQRQRVSPSP